MHQRIMLAQVLLYAASSAAHCWRSTALPQLRWLSSALHKLHLTATPVAKTAAGE
jgi:hypothetical protein